MFVHSTPTNNISDLFVPYLPSYLINNELDPCEKIICNGTNAQCQVYLGGKNKGKAFCACPQGFTGDPDFNCGKYV